MEDSDLQADLRHLLHQGEANSQELLCIKLESLGHSVNQSKISRLLRKIGAVKTKNEDGIVVYRLPLEPAPPTPDSRLTNLVIEMMANETMIVIYTHPGAAQLIARVLDHHKDKVEILGVIAGDDTIFVAPCSINNLTKTLSAIRKLLF